MNKPFLLPTLILVTLAALAISACGIQSTPAPGEPVSSSDSTSTPPAADWQPQPGDDRLTTGRVEITSTEILSLESFPPQFVVSIEGSKPTPCHQLRARVADPEPDEKSIRIEVYTVFDPDEICTQVIQDFNLNIPLGSYPAGQYTVQVNGAEIGQIVAP
ncbi:hypothetical protein LARV_01183 [Longilinea arvoryzae]|uniref:Uncharacterized protein n=1 Tax=Longilinea arvoryzae TaxID=360412 RepID=A0A0S7BI11_9CHLR|nr:hypothetical protein [Longilinea arvoryzae]GAP13429.1 hypothetical protein LARV_01183 [Longilinea arvoryzae]